MAKKIITFLCTLTLVFSLTFSAFALDFPVAGDTFSFNSFFNLTQQINSNGFNYFILFYAKNDGVYVFVRSEKPFQFDSVSLIPDMSVKTQYCQYGLRGELAWLGWGTFNKSSFSGQIKMIWSSHNLSYNGVNTYSTSDNITDQFTVGTVSLTSLVANYTEGGSSSSGGSGGSSSGNVTVDMTKTNSILTSIKTALEDFKSTVSTLLNNIKNSVDIGFENVKTYFAGLFTRLNNFNESINAKLDEILSEIRQDVDYNFNPNSEQLEGSFGESLQTELNNKYTFINDFKSSLNNLNGDYGGIDISKTVNLGIFKIPIKINFEWYEPYRVKIKNIMAIFVYCLGGLACLRVILGVFDIYLGRITSAFMPDSSLEAGKSNINYNVGSNASNPVIENNFNLLN